jgi:hypothetical protein
MSHAASLPERLQYLQPFRKQFASRPEELNEDSGFAPLLALLQKRIAKRSVEEAEKLLEEDIATLENWLASPDQINDCLHFARGVFLIASPAELVKQVRAESEKQKEPLPWVEMDLPTNIKPRRFEKEGEGGMLVKWKGLWFTISVISDEKAAKGEKPAALWDPKNEVTCSSVQFSKVTGLKYVEIMQLESGRPHKRIIYVLAVPGGHLEISINFIGKKPSSKWDEAKLEEWRREQALIGSKWDETPVESFFHSLRIVMKQPSNIKFL